MDSGGEDDGVDRTEGLFGEKEDPESDEERAGHVGHHCTDIMCLLLFLGALVPIYWIGQYSHENGDLRKIYHGFNFLGELCGVDTNSSNNTLGKYLWWCEIEGQPGVLDLEHPVCRDDCPTSSTSSWPCYIGSSKSDPQYSSAGSFTQVTEYNFEERPDYESFVFAFRYCLPKDNAAMDQIVGVLDDHWSTRWIMDFSGLINAWLALFFSGLLAIVLGYAYLFLLRCCAGPLVWTCVVIMILAPLVMGLYFMTLIFDGGADGVGGTGDGMLDGIIGATLCTVSLVFACLACCFRHSVEVAIGCIMAACECMFAMPSLLIEPLQNLLLKLTLLISMFIGLLWLMSTGEMTKVTIQQYVYDVPGLNIAGVHRSFDWNEDQKKMMLYYIFMMFWIEALLTAFSQFVLAYAVQLWYFTPYQDGQKASRCFPLARGYRIGLMYHLGSLAFGALIIAVIRMIRVALAYLVKQLKKQDNQCLTCLAKCCACLVSCFQRCIEFLNKNAYMDIAITSSTFCTAARRAFEIIVKEFAAMGVLNGATWIFQIAGVASITAGGTYLTLIILRSNSVFTDLESEHYVPDPVFVTVFAGILCAIIAVAFMIVFDTVADSVLYCFAIEKKRRAKGMYDPDDQYAPEVLHELVEE